MFKSNESGLDRILRILFGAAIVSLAFIGPKTPFAYLGLIFVITGVVGWCPIYTVLGLSTKSKPPKE